MQLTSITVFAAILLARCISDRGPMIQVTAQSGSVSIDCGSSDTTYTDEQSGLFWMSDSKQFGLEKVSRTADVSLPALNQYRWLSSMRIFEGKQSKYCYAFDEDIGIVRSIPYLIRASFWIGDNYPQLPLSAPNKQQISFKLLLNADEWDDIIISFPQKKPLVKEVYVFADHLSSISVCVASSSDPAFISSLELRPIAQDWASVEYFMKAQSNTTTPKLLFLYARLGLGLSTGSELRYPDDFYDRIWSSPDIAGSSTLKITASDILSTTSRTFSTTIFPEKIPSAVLQTARTHNSSFNITFDGFSRSYDFFYDLYYAEISDDVTAPQQRVFNEYTINASGIEQYTTNIDPYTKADKVAGYYGFELIPVDEGGYLTFSFEKDSSSLFGPLVSALELRYSSPNPMSLGTYEANGEALKHIKRQFQGFDSWSGDPCLPFPYEWLTCDQNIPPHITELSLQNKNITAQIPVEISNLQALVKIDLRGNNLSGLIPESIAQLPNLQILLLQDNNLSGPIPQALLEKKIEFSVAGNPNLCKGINETYCDEQQLQAKSNADSTKAMPIVAIVVSIFLLLL